MATLAPLFFDQKNPHRLIISSKHMPCIVSYIEHWVIYEPCHEKTCFLHMQKHYTDQRRSNCVADQHLCFLYIYSRLVVAMTMIEQIFRGCTARFVLDLVGNPEDGFSRDKARIVIFSKSNLKDMN